MMKFTRTGTLKKDSLDELVTLNPFEMIPNILFEHLDCFVGFVVAKTPAEIGNFVNSLTKKFQGLVSEDYWQNLSEESKQIHTKFKNIKHFPALNQAALNYFIELLQLGEKDGWETSGVEVPRRALVEAWIFPPYYFLESLAETIGRDEAISLYKRYITHYYIVHPSPDREKFVSLERMLETRLSGDTTSSEWVIVHAMLEEGKYAFKNENCPTCFDAAKELPDVEFQYLVCCYGDYEKFRANSNDHIVLTMEHTLIQGDPYCSRVLHDTRVDYDLRHPPKEFWDHFRPGKEEEAKRYYKK
jgi:hypothetical protein